MNLIREIRQKQKRVKIRKWIKNKARQGSGPSGQSSSQAGEAEQGPASLALPSWPGSLTRLR